MKLVVKSAILLFFSILSLSSFAQNEPSPYDLCKDRFCTKQMIEMLTDFSEASHQPSLDLAGFSGSCFHIHPNLNPDMEHHGVMLLRDNHPNKKFTGLFSFYTKENPYKELTLTGLRDFFDKRGSRRHAVTDQTEFESVLIASESADIFYWFKTTANGAWLLSLWNYHDALADVRIFCHFPQTHKD